MSGLLNHSPAEIVQQALIDAGHGTDPDTSPGEQWNVFNGSEADLPDHGIVVKDTTGREDGASQITGQVERREGMQLLIRSGKNGVGRRKANVIQNWMERTLYAANVTIAAKVTPDETIAAGTYRLHCFADVGTPLPLGKAAASSRFVHSMNVTAVLWQLS